MQKLIRKLCLPKTSQRLKGTVFHQVRAFAFFFAFSACLFLAPTAHAAKDFNIKNDTQSFLFVNGTTGSVGIGTTMTGASAGTKLAVVDGNVGIGTTDTSRAAFTVMNGNVGIGTWAPAKALDVRGGGCFKSVWRKNLYYFTQ